MKILITGANGYVGQGIVKKFLDNGHIVVATDINDENIDKRAEIKKCDLFSVEKPFLFFDKPDIVLHLAWRGIYSHNSSIIMEDLPKHYLFLRSMIEDGVKHIAVLGTMHEVGNYEGMITDDTPRKPITLYGICKNTLRESLEVLQNEYDFVFQWLMGFYTIGTDDINVSEGNVFLKISQAEKNGNKTFPFVTGNNRFDFVKYYDFIDMIYYSLIQNDVNGTIYCCHGNPVRLKDQAQKYIDDNKFKIELEIGKYPDRKNEPNCIYGDSTKIKEIFANANVKFK